MSDGRAEKLSGSRRDRRAVGLHVAAKLHHPKRVARGRKYRSEIALAEAGGQASGQQQHADQCHGSRKPDDRSRALANQEPGREWCHHRCRVHQEARIGDRGAEIGDLLDGDGN